MNLGLFTGKDQASSSTVSGHWYDAWLDGKMDDGKSDFLVDFWEKSGWRFRVFCVWLVVVIFGGPICNLLGLGSFSTVICLVVGIGLPVGYVALWRYVSSPRSSDDVRRSVFELLCRAGVISQSSLYSDWDVKDVDVQDSRVQCTVYCTEPGGKSLVGLTDVLRREARRMWVCGKSPQDVFVSQQGSGAYYTLILQFETVAGRVEFLDSSSANYWGLPTYPDGNFTGQYALGEIVAGIDQGKVLTGSLWNKGGAYHTGLSGMSGWGKSNTLHFYFCQWARMPQVQIVYVDPQGTDGAFWRDRAIVVTGSGDDFSPCVKALDTIQRICNDRAKIIEQNGWKNWEVTPRSPCIVFAVDEVSFLVDQGKDILPRMLNLSRVARKFGVALVYATQYPVKRVVGDCWGQMTYRVGTRTNNLAETEVVFGPRAAECPAHNLSQRGQFYVYSSQMFPGPPSRDTQLVQVPNGADDYARQIARATSRFKDASLARLFGDFPQADYTCVNYGDERSQGVSDDDWFM